MIISKLLTLKWEKHQISRNFFNGFCWHIWNNLEYLLLSKIHHGTQCHDAMFEIILQLYFFCQLVNGFCIVLCTQFDKYIYIYIYIYSRFWIIYCISLIRNKFPWFGSFTVFWLQNMVSISLFWSSYVITDSIKDIARPIQWLKKFCNFI